MSVPGIQAQCVRLGVLLEAKFNNNKKGHQPAGSTKSFSSECVEVQKRSFENPRSATEICPNKLNSAQSNTEFGREIANGQLLFLALLCVLKYLLV